MKKIDDSRLYLWFTAVTLGIALVCGALAVYSMVRVEPKIEALLAAEDDAASAYREAYLMLRDPQIFARYENFDVAAQPVKFILRDFDRRVSAGEALTADDGLYLGILLERRQLGSELTRNTAVFFALLSLFGLGMFLYERRSLKGA
ncbi:MAG: hypothetical protein KBA15_00710 [Spirochaetes bacterium]|jgi:hypothetical protein|nr:hypothetical protein [Spirochaetota bacterium]